MAPATSWPSATPQLSLGRRSSQSVATAALAGLVLALERRESRIRGGPHRAAPLFWQ